MVPRTNETDLYPPLSDTSVIQNGRWLRPGKHRARRRRWAASGNRHVTTGPGLLTARGSAEAVADKEGVTPLLSLNICASTLVFGCGPHRFDCPEEQGGQRSELVVEKPHFRRAALRQRFPQLR
jgi:hypothetical protein